MTEQDAALARYLAQFAGVAPRRRGRVRVRPTPWYIISTGVVVAFKGAMVQRMNVEVEENKGVRDER